MGDRNKGLVHLYSVERIDGTPVGPCIVLPFSDPRSHPAMLQYADTVEADGYNLLAADIREAVRKEKER